MHLFYFLELRCNTSGREKYVVFNNNKKRTTTKRKQQKKELVHT
jgi:hypothetical protein